MDACLNFHLALVVLSSWAFECYLAFCQREGEKRNLATPYDTFTVLLDVHWKTGVGNAERLMMWKIQSDVMVEFFC